MGIVTAGCAVVICAIGIWSRRFKHQDARPDYESLSVAKVTNSGRRTEPPNEPRAPISQHAPTSSVDIKVAEGPVSQAAKLVQASKSIRDFWFQHGSAVIDILTSGDVSLISFFRSSNALKSDQDKFALLESICSAAVGDTLLLDNINQGILPPFRLILYEWAL
jgi:hypothetical protein